MFGELLFYTVILRGLRVVNGLQEIFESMGSIVDGVKFSGGSDNLLPKSFIKEVINKAHQHDVYVSTGEWAEHLMHNGPSAFREYLEVRFGMRIVLEYI